MAEADRFPAPIINAEVDVKPERGSKSPNLAMGA
jgi:hypothetical protein